MFQISKLFLLILFLAYSQPILADETNTEIDTVAKDSVVVTAQTTASLTTSLTKPAFIHEDHTHDFHWEQYAIPAAITTASAFFVETPKLVQARHWVQEQIANPTGQPKTAVDDYIQYLPMLSSYALYFCGVKGEHNLVDRTIILAMSYATFAVVNHTMKFAFDEKRPNTGALNSFPSGHTGTCFVGAEFLRREYWSTNKWIGVAGYACATAVAYLRIYNNRHWINDVVAGAAIGYMSTSFAYWLYPKIFRKRHERHQQELLRGVDPEGFTASSDLEILRKDDSVKWFATPFASASSAGVSCLVTF